MAEDCTLWFGSNRIQDSSNRLTLPPQTFTLEIAQKGVPLHFFIEEETDRVAISKRLLADGGRNAGPAQKEICLDRIDNNDVGNNRVVTIPKQFFPEFEGRAHGSQPVREAAQFTYGLQCHFVTTTRLHEADACYLLKDEREIFDIMNENPDDLIPDGSGGSSDSFEPPELDENEVLWIEEDEIISVEEGKSLLKGGSSPHHVEYDQDGKDEDMEHDYSLEELESETLELSEIFGPKRRRRRDRRNRRYEAFVVVGHDDGYLGLGVGIDASPDLAKRKAKVRASSEFGTPIDLGCGRQCTCGNEHTVAGKAVASRNGIHIEIRPAPRGVGIQNGGRGDEEEIKTVATMLEMAGIEDALITVEGWNQFSPEPLAWATFEALCRRSGGSQFEARPDRRSKRGDIF